MPRALAVLALVPALGWTSLTAAPAATRLDSALEIRAALEVRILTQYLDPGTHKVLMDETFQTEIADGVNRGAAFFYLVE